jgi:NADH-quinone oxidoreductase subunit G
MAIVIIDGNEIEIPEGRRLNCIQAAALAGVEIPHYCWHPGLSVVGSCRMCLVEIGARDPETGQVAMQPKLTPACNTPAKDGTVIVTTGEKVQQARAMVEEGLLLRHPIDCPICDKAGECRLQDYHFQYGQDERRADLRPFSSRRRDIGDVTLFVDRCILCSRCVRFTREITGTGELMVAGRGAQEEIDVMPGFPLSNKLSGNVVDLCPVGALGDKDFLYRQRVWFLKRHAGVCTGCATGCSIWVEENQDHIWRIKPRENPEVNRWWICNDGRYGYHHVHDGRRLVRPQRRDGQSVVDLDWKGLPGELTERLRAAGRLAAVLSPLLTVEEAYLLATLVRGIDPRAALVLGPVPVVGEDEQFAGGFAIAAEKCPNRRGVEAVLAHFTGGATALDRFLAGLPQSGIRGVWVSGGYRGDWIDQATAGRFAGLDLLVVQDLFDSPLAQQATYVLPGAAFAERDGSYVNRADRLQSVHWAVRPPAGVRPEGGLFWEMSGRTGLYNAREVLSDVAAEILYFAAAGGEIPDTGVDLKVNLLAAAAAGGKNA